MADAFGSLLAAHLTACSLGVRAFAREAKVVHSHVQRIMAGKRRPPLDALPTWADVLGLTGKDRDRFILAGQLTHCPEAVRAYVAKLETEAGRKRRS